MSVSQDVTGRACNEAADIHARAAPAIARCQERALQALLTGSTDAEAANAANVARETVNRWRHRDANFIAPLNQARQGVAQDFQDGLRALLPGAIAALRDGLASDNINTRLVPPPRSSAPSGTSTSPQGQPTRKRFV